MDENDAPIRLSNATGRVMAMIVTRAPTRLDFGGGWTDVPPYAEESGGFVCNVAISRYATVRVAAAGQGLDVAVDRPGDETLVSAVASRLGVSGVRIALRNDFPVGAGLGGSSAAGVATIAALAKWCDKTIERQPLAELSRDIETKELGIAGGRQDHYAAAFGGALGLRFGESVHVTRIPLAAAVCAELARRCLVIYTGQSRISGTTITAVLGAYRAGDRTVTTALRRMRELAEAMPAVLERGAFDELGALVSEQWSFQRTLNDAIPTPRIDTIIDRALAAGASGAKALGASGGGCVLVIAGAETAEAVRDAIAPLGEMIDFAVDVEGVTQCA
jgi:D-glycero-alpha-D-manno-heptose-7-phosphate kinase